MVVEKYLLRSYVKFLAVLILLFFLFFFLEDQNFSSKSIEYYKQMIKEADKNGDGEVIIHINYMLQIDYNEFIMMMDKGGS